MDNQTWLEYFKTNERRAPAEIPARIAVSRTLRDPLAAALRLFQAGETGEGRVVHEARRVAPDDHAFQESMRLYIAEEGRHARELGMLVRAVDPAPRPTIAPSATFTRARRLAGFWGKMAVLTAAEVVGIVFYDLLAESVPDPAFSSTVANISSEERAHIAFQRDTFERLATRAPARAEGAARWGLEVAMLATTGVATLAFAAQVRTLLSKLGVGPGAIVDATRRVLREVVDTPSEVVVWRRARRAGPANEAAQGVVGSPRYSDAAGAPPRSLAPFGWLGAA